MKLFGSKQTKGLQTLEEVQTFLDNIDYINCGGCGISALAMYRWLKKHGKTTKQTAFYFLEHDESNHMNNKEYFSNKEITLKAPCHVVLYHNEETIDCSGSVYISHYEYQLIEKSEEFLLAMINSIRTWNWMFNRKLFVPEIAKELNIDLSDVILIRE